MKFSTLITFAFLLALVYGRDLKSGNVLSTVKGSDGWGNWFNDLIFIIFEGIGLFWCNIRGFLGGLGGDNLLGYQNCWAGWMVFFYGGSW